MSLPAANLDFDLTDLDNFRDGFPFEAFRALREHDPIHWHEPTANTPDGEGFWVLSRHAQVVEVFKNPGDFSSHTGGDRPYGGTFIADVKTAGLMLNMMDDPRHRRIRGLVNSGFTPRVIGALEPELRRRARAILADVGDEGEIDFVVEVARELPLQAISMLLGVPQEMRGQLCDWIDIGLEYSGRKLGEVSEEAAQANANMIAFAQELIAEKTRNPKDDMLSIVIHARMEDADPPTLSNAEILQFYMLLFAAGTETTRKAIAGGLKALLETPGELERMRAHPELMETAVDEIVRYTTSSVYKRRTVTRDLEFHGKEFRAGEKVTLWEMSANRDDRVFEDPDRFDIARDPNPHVAFGWGVHRCLGANLAKLEIRVMFEELLAAWDEIEITGAPVWTRDNRLFGLKHLPVRFEGRAPVDP